MPNISTTLSLLRAEEFIVRLETISKHLNEDNLWRLDSWSVNPKK